jgi:hypothetical protein
MLKTHSLPFTELKLARTQARLLPSAQTQQILLDLDPVFIQEMQSTKKPISRHSDSARPSTAALLRTLPAVLLNFFKNQACYALNNPQPNKAQTHSS